MHCTPQLNYCWFHLQLNHYIVLNYEFLNAALQLLEILAALENTINSCRLYSTQVQQTS